MESASAETGIPADAVALARKPGSVSRSKVTPVRLAFIRLGRPLPNASCGLPWGSGGQPSSAPIRGLAPGGVCRATTVAGCAVGSYPAVSPLLEAHWVARAVYFLWHFPRGRPHRVLPGTLPCGARTFLPTRVGLSDRLCYCDAGESSTGVGSRVVLTRYT